MRACSLTREIQASRGSAGSSLSRLRSNLYIESLTDGMAGIEEQNHDPGVEQQLQANRLVKEPGHGYRQKITERHPNESAHQSAHDRREPN